MFFDSFTSFSSALADSEKKERRKEKKERNKIYKKARKSFLEFNNKAIDRSIKGYNKMLETETKSARAYAGLAEAYSFKGFFNKESKIEYENEFNLAHQNIKKSLELDPDSSDVRRALVYFNLNLNRTKEALNIANKLLREKKNSWENLYLVWAADGKKPEDERIKNVIKSNSSSVLANYELAKAYYERKGDPVKAIVYLMKALEISESAYFRTYLGTIYRSRRLLTKSIEEFDKALKINPKSAFALTNKGISLYYSRNYTESIKCLLGGLKLGNKMPEAYFFLGSNYLKKGDKRKSLLNYNKFIKEVTGKTRYKNYVKIAMKNMLES